MGEGAGWFIVGEHFRGDNVIARACVGFRVADFRGQCSGPDSFGGFGAGLEFRAWGCGGLKGIRLALPNSKASMRVSPKIVSANSGFGACLF